MIFVSARWEKKGKVTYVVDLPLDGFPTIPIKGSLGIFWSEWKWFIGIVLYGSWFFFSSSIDWFEALGLIQKNKEKGNESIKED